MLVEKRREERHKRLERYRETGRVVTLVSDEQQTWDDLHSEPVEQQPETDHENGRSAGKRVMDGFLLAVEVIAVLGLIFVLFNGLDILQELNREVAVALEQPTLTPTPLVKAVVLPSGHTPPDTEGGSRPNIEEIPEHLRPLRSSFAEVPIPTVGPDHAIRIQIPAIDQDAPIVAGDGWEQLKKGVGHRVGSANPGEEGNVVLSAHNDIYGEIFKDLDKLEKGDEVVLFTERERYVYQVSAIKIVEPTQVEFLEPTSEPIATLISCYPYLVDNKRIVVIADFISP